MEDDMLIDAAYARMARHFALSYIKILTGQFAIDGGCEKMGNGEYRQIRRKFLDGVGKIWFWWGGVSHLYKPVYDWFEEHPTLEGSVKDAKRRGVWTGK